MAASNPSTFNFVFTGTTDDEASAVYTSIRSSVGSENFEDEQTFKTYLTKVKERSGAVGQEGTLEDAKSKDYKSKFTDIKRRSNADSNNTLAAIGYTSNNVTTMSFALEATASIYRGKTGQIQVLDVVSLEDLIQKEKVAAENMYKGRHTGGGTAKEALQQDARRQWNVFASKDVSHNTFLGGAQITAILNQPANPAYGTSITPIGSGYQRPNVYFGPDGGAPDSLSSNLSPNTQFIPSESEYFRQRRSYHSQQDPTAQQEPINVQVSQAPATMGTEFRNQFMNNLFDPTPTAPGQLISMDGKTLAVLTTNSSNNASSTTP